MAIPTSINGDIPAIRCYRLEDELATIREKVGKQAGNERRTENNDRTKTLRSCAARGQLLQNTATESIVIDVRNGLAQLPIKPIDILCFVHYLVSHAASVFFNFSRPRSTLVLTVPSGMSSTARGFIVRKPVLTAEQDGRTLVQWEEIERVHKIVPQTGVHCLWILFSFQSVFINPDQLFAAAGVLSKNIVGDAVEPG